MRFALGLLTLFPWNLTSVASEEPLPKVAEGWSIERVARAPEIAYPTAVVVARDGTIYLGQDPMDMPGPLTEPVDSVVTVRDGKVSTFADKLWAVMGLEWVDGTLYVVHPPFLSSFRDVDGDGKAETRVDLITSLGPDRPGSSGLNDHIASGLRLGMDGFLYVAVGDKGLPRARGRDGSTITMATGGVIRIRPDGTGLEVVSTGERNPLSVALTVRDDVFTFGNDDDSKRWPNSLTHHIVGGHYGYPYEFLTAPYRALPIVDGQLGGAGAQGLSYDEDGLPARYRGNLFFCDWGLQVVHRLIVEPAGGTFRVASKESLVEKGDLADFRPFSIAVGADGASLYLVDWAFSGWRSSGPKTGRLYRLTYTGTDQVCSASRPVPPIEGLDHPARAVRLEAQRRLVSQGADSVELLASRLKSTVPGSGRIHALWALDAIGTSPARQAIRAALGDPDADVRLQAVRSSGIRRDREAFPALTSALRDPTPAVRRESAIALNRLGEASASAALYAALGDGDRFAAWSIRRAIRGLGVWDPGALSAALADPRRREDALTLADESWSVVAVKALASELTGSTDPAWKARLVSALAGNYHRYPAWSGQWFGPNPLAGAMPKKTVAWDAEGMGVVLIGLAKGLSDADPNVRRQAIGGLFGVGERAAPILRVGLDREIDPMNLVAIARVLGTLGDANAAPTLGKLLLDPGQPIEVRSSTLDALEALNSPQALNARLKLAYDGKAPAELIARALPALGRARVLPANDLAGFLDHPSDAVRASALAGFPTGKVLPANLRAVFLAKLDDPSTLVVKAAIEAVVTHKLGEAVPRLIGLAGEEATRTEATRGLALRPDPRAVRVYVAALSDRDPSVRQACESALVAIRGIDAGQSESAARDEKLEKLRAFALSHRGDARNGEALFFDPKGIGCSKCHAVGGRGLGTSNLGPNLAGLAANQDTAEIVRSILEPSNRIAPAYRTVVITRRDGTTATGLLKAEDAGHVDLVDVDRRAIRVARPDIESQKFGEVSLMPTGLVDTLAPVEFADLITYLSGLKAVKPAGP